MKTTHRIALTGTLLFLTFIIISGCKKKSEDPAPADPTPTFTVTYDSVNLVAGGKGLEFKATCTNNGVKMTKVIITNPSSGIYVYEINGTTYTQNSPFPLQTTGTAYPKALGTWKFSLIGTSTGGTAFVVDPAVTVTK
jgi:hypothetical protein